MAERAHPEDPAFQDRWVWKRALCGWLRYPLLERSPWKRGLIKRYAYCQPYVRGKRVLDVPCGCGWGTAMLRGVCALTGVDRSQQAIDYARRRYAGHGQFQIGDMEHLAFRNESFDVVMCLEGIEHVPVETAHRFVDEAERVLSPDGLIIVTNPIPDLDRLPNPYHCHEYDKEELVELLGRRFEPCVVEVQEVFGVEIVYYVGRRRHSSGEEIESGASCVSLDSKAI